MYKTTKLTIEPYTGKNSKQIACNIEYAEYDKKEKLWNDRFSSYFGEKSKKGKEIKKILNLFAKEVKRIDRRG